jgi:Uma2 family endonuclease
MIQLEAELIRIPDVAFISKERYAGKIVKPGAFWELGCDLAVEVISPSNTRREMERKLEDYFNAGVRMVWLVYPDSREVAVYSSPVESAVLKGNDVIDGGTVLPGFTVSVSEIFAELD